MVCTRREHTGRPSSCDMLTCIQVVFYMLTLNSDLILSLINFGNAYDDVYKSLFRLCVGNILLTIGGYIPGFGASFLLIDVWGRKPIQIMGFIILTILFWIMSMPIGSGVFRMIADTPLRF